jgi:plastocyanin
MKLRALKVFLVCLLVWWTLPATAATVTVHVFNFNFSTNPAGQPIVEATINVGDTIHWEFDAGTHSTTSVTGSLESWDSGILSSGHTFDHTFTAAGTYIYYCKIHGSDNGNGTASGMSGMVTVQAAPPSVASLTVPATVVGSLTATGKVTLDAAAPAGGSVVTLASTNAAATVPASVTVPAGALTASFKFTTVAVSAIESGEIMASYNGTVSKAIKVRPISVSSLTLVPASVTAGSSTTATLKLEAPAAPNAITVTFVSTNHKVALDPASITIPAGTHIVTFSVATIAGSSGTTIIEAKANGLVKKSNVLTVH